MSKQIPLAHRVRPAALEGFIGHEEARTFLTDFLAGQRRSVIIWGPPGTGKTTLANIIAQHYKGAFFSVSAVTSGVKELREVTSAAQGAEIAPIFADPTGQPIGYLPREAAYGGTIVPVVVHDAHWVKVLLAGRQGLPPEGSAAQAVGWLRVTDVTLTRAESFVEVHLEARTIDIVTATGRERVANDFAWGKPSTPTPVGPR